MPKQFPLAVKDTALALYLQGDKSAREIVEVLWEKYNIEVKAPTIYAWAREGGWGIEQGEIRTQALEQIKEGEGQRFARVQREHLDNYESLRHKAEDALDHLVFDKAFDAAKVLDLSIKGERQVIEGMINLQFVQNVLGVLVDEINDETVLRRIAGRLKSLIQTEEPAKI